MAIFQQLLLPSFKVQWVPLLNRTLLLQRKHTHTTTAGWLCGTHGSLISYRSVEVKFSKTLSSSLLTAQNSRTGAYGLARRHTTHFSSVAELMLCGKRRDKEWAWCAVVGVSHAAGWGSKPHSLPGPVSLVWTVLQYVVPSYYVLVCAVCGAPLFRLAPSTAATIGTTTQARQC